MNPLYEAAEWSAENFGPVFPLDHPDLRECAGIHSAKNPCNGTRGKHPTVKWSREGSLDPAQLRTWFGSGSRNIGLDCGAAGLLVIDEDEVGAFQAFADSIGEVIPETFKVRTARGFHFYFNQDGSLSNKEGQLAGRHINARGVGGFVVAVGSVHESGWVYEAVDPHAPLADVPGWLARCLRNRAAVGEVKASATTGLTDGAAEDEVPAGQRHAGALSLAGTMRAQDVPLLEAKKRMNAFWETFEQPEGETYPLADAIEVVDDVYRRYDAGRPSIGRRLVVTRASEIQPQAVRWVWQDRVPAGCLALLAGREGIGKSTVAYQLVADITRGQLPGQHFGTARCVVIAATEDSWAHTIVPRLMAAGADLNRVLRVDVEIHGEEGEAELSLPRDVAALGELVREEDVALVLLDPLMSRLSSGLDTHKDAEVRQALEPVTRVAGDTGVSVLGIIHLNKGKGDGLDRLMGSRAFPAVARAVLYVLKDPEDEALRLLAVAKNNLGRSDLPLMRFTIESANVAADREDPIWTGQTFWLDPDERSLDEVLAASDEGSSVRTATAEAASWLQDYLQINEGSADSADIKREGRKAGHNTEALKRACRSLKIVVTSHGFPRKTVWALPPAPQTAKSSQPGETHLTDPTDPTEG